MTTDRPMRMTTDKYRKQIVDTRNAVFEAITEAASAIDEAVWAHDLDFELRDFPDIPDDPEDATEAHWDAWADYEIWKEHFVHCTGYAVEEVLAVLVEADELVKGAA